MGKKVKSAVKGKAKSAATQKARARPAKRTQDSEPKPKRPNKAAKTVEETNPFDQPPPEGQTSLSSEVFQKAALKEPALTESQSNKSDSDSERVSSTSGSSSSKATSCACGEGAAEAGGAESQPLPCLLQFDDADSPEFLTEYHSQGNRDASMTKDLREVFNHHFRSVARIVQRWGQEALDRLRYNLDYLRVTSLYSGLGGAELASWLCYKAVAAHQDRVDGLQPGPPVPLLACELDGHCRKVLNSHHALCLSSVAT